MVMVRCVECVNWSLRDAPKEVAMFGFGVCKAATPKTPWRYLSATCDERLHEQLRLATVDQAIAEAEASDAHAENKRLQESLAALEQETE